MKDDRGTVPRVLSVPWPENLFISVWIYLPCLFPLQLLTSFCNYDILSFWPSLIFFVPNPTLNQSPTKDNHLIF